MPSFCTWGNRGSERPGDVPEVLWWVRVKPGLECNSSGSCQGPVCQPHPASSSSLLCWTRGHLLLGSSKDSGKCLGIWKVPLGDPDFYVLCHPSLTSGHWLRGSVQVGTVSPQARTLGSLLSCSRPCLDALVPSGHQASLPSCGSHCLCSSSRHLLGPCLLRRTIPVAGPCSSWLLLPSYMLDAMASSGPCRDPWALPRAQASLALWRFQPARRHWALAVGAGAGWRHVVLAPGPTV